jgi:hypothetical protein
VAPTVDIQHSTAPMFGNLSSLEADLAVQLELVQQIEGRTGA